MCWQEWPPGGGDIVCPLFLRVWSYAVREWEAERELTRGRVKSDILGSSGLTMGRNMSYNVYKAEWGHP